uniref:Cystatin domain-containing protein n=1 Tax=Strongyloides venezuelensis TaxID=75913 RepID=A0A0K0G4E7_STRVS
MNYLNVSILIIGTFLMATGTSFNLFNHHDTYGWVDKKTNSSKILKLAEKSVDQFNKKYDTNVKLENVISAKKGHTGDSKHYNLEILATVDCGNNFVKCSERIHSDIYKRKGKGSGLLFNVYKEGILKYR